MERAFLESGKDLPRLRSRYVFRFIQLLDYEKHASVAK